MKKLVVMLIILISCINLFGSGGERKIRQFDKFSFIKYKLSSIENSTILASNSMFKHALLNDYYKVFESTPFSKQPLFSYIFDPPTSWTRYYGLRKWEEGDNPSADSINANWDEIDFVLFDLVINVDPRYFSWEDIGKDTLTLNTYNFGTLGFAPGENLFLPLHSSPFTNFGDGAIGNSSGLVIFKNSIAGRIDTLVSNHYLREQAAELFGEVAYANNLSEGTYNWDIDTTRTVNVDYAKAAGGVQDADFIDINISSYSFSSPPPFREGRMWYDSVNKSFVAWGDEAETQPNPTREITVRVYNDSGDDILDGQVVCYNGSTFNGFPRVLLALASIDSLSHVRGIATHNIENGSFGYITNFGKLSGINTEGKPGGKPIFLSPSVPGGWTTVKPGVNYNLVELGSVLEVGVNGSLFADLMKWDYINAGGAIAFKDSASVVPLTIDVEGRITNSDGNLFALDQLVTHDLILSGDSLYFHHRGVFTIIGHFSFGGGAGGKYEFYIKDKSSVLSLYNSSITTGSSDVVDINLIAVVSIEAIGDYVTFWVTNTGSSTDAIFEDGIFVITQIR